MHSCLFRELQLIIVLLLICVQFLYELKRKGYLSKTVRGIFHFRLRLIFIKVYIFVRHKSIESLTVKRDNSLRNRNNKKKIIENWLISAWVGALQKLIWRRTFELMKSKFWESHFFSIVTFKQIFDIPLLNNLFISFNNLLFISLVELKNIY